MSTNRAFTLVELLVVTAILGMATAVIAACMGVGMRAWDAARRFNTVESEAAFALAVMERDFRNAFPLDRIAFDGQSASASFPGLVSGEDAAGEGLGTVSYTFEAGKGRLVRSAAAYASDDAVSETLLSGLSGLRVRYLMPPEGDAKEGIWVEQSTNFPGAVEINLVFDESGDPFDIQKTVVLPVGW